MSVHGDSVRRSELPCKFACKDPYSGEAILTKPCVDCKRDCLSCGWNPAERRRRFLHGSFERRNVMVGGRTTPVLRLVFPPREAAHGD